MVLVCGRVRVRKGWWGGDGCAEDGGGGDVWQLVWEKQWLSFIVNCFHENLEISSLKYRVLLLFEQPLRGKGPVDLITVDSLIELQDSQNPFQYWIVRVIENVGGRLRLRYVGLEHTESYDRWLFYLDYRLRPIGWCQEKNYRMDPPSGERRRLLFFLLDVLVMSRDTPACASFTCQYMDLRCVNVGVFWTENKIQETDEKHSQRRAWCRRTQQHQPAPSAGPIPVGSLARKWTNERGDRLGF